MERSWTVDPEGDALRIAGIDTESGLKRLGGKRERYEALLRKFADRQAEAVDAIRAALSAGDMATAEREAHSLKGAAATLGADHLAEDAAKAELAIKSGNGVDRELLSLSRSLDGVVTAIKTALPA
jgi:two-component system sensor histidine kinase/response regulator